MRAVTGIEAPTGPEQHGRFGLYDQIACRETELRNAIKLQPFAHRWGRAPSPLAGITNGEGWLIMQLVGPTVGTAKAEDLVHTVLHLTTKSVRPDQAQCYR